MTRAAVHRAEALEVRPRWAVHVVFLVALLAVGATLAAMRRGELDVDENVASAIVLVLCFWLFAITLGSLVRAMRAGYALRLDAAGVHIPGLAVLPWGAVRAARLRVEERAGRRSRQLVLDVEPGYSGGRLRDYERYLFGPIAGLFGPRDTVAIPIAILAIAPNALLAATDAFLAARAQRVEVRADGARARGDRRRSDRHLP